MINNKSTLLGTLALFSCLLFPVESINANDSFQVKIDEEFSGKSPSFDSAFKFKDTVVLVVSQEGPLKTFLGVDSSSGKKRWKHTENNYYEPSKLGNFIVTQNKLIDSKTGKIKVNTKKLYMWNRKKYVIADGFDDPNYWVFGENGRLIKKIKKDKIRFTTNRWLPDGNIFSFGAYKAHIVTPTGKAVWKCKIPASKSGLGLNFMIRKDKSRYLIVQFSRNSKKQLPFQFRTLGPKVSKVSTIKKEGADLYGDLFNIFKLNKKWKLLISNKYERNYYLVDLASKKVDSTYTYKSSPRYLYDNYIAQHDKIIDLKTQEVLHTFKKSGIGDHGNSNYQDNHLYIYASRVYDKKFRQHHFFNTFNIKTQKHWKAPLSEQILSVSIEKEPYLLAWKSMFSNNKSNFGIIDLKQQKISTIGSFNEGTDINMYKAWFEEDHLLAIFSSKKNKDSNREFYLVSQKISKN